MAYDLNRWLRQPTTIHALGVIAAGVGAGLAQVVTGNPKIDAVVAGIAYVLTHLGIDDHSAMEATATKVVSDVAVVGSTAGSNLIADTVALINAVQAATTTPQPTHEAPAAPTPAPAPAPSPAPAAA